VLDLVLGLVSDPAFRRCRRCFAASVGSLAAGDRLGDANRA
jgi:hypothetical protein